MKKALKNFRVVYITGIHPDVVVQATDEHAAKVEALAILRKGEALMDTRPLEKVVSHAIEL